MTAIVLQAFKPMLTSIQILLYFVFISVIVIIDIVIEVSHACKYRMGLLTMALLLDKVCVSL